MSRRIQFQFRAFVSLLAAFSFIMVAVTGVILYISPKGRIANWTNWTFWQLDKEQWAALHICFTAVFVLLCLVHTWLNIRPLLNYLGRKIESGRLFRYEWIAALLACGLILWGGLKPFEPFNSLLSLREQLKVGRDNPKEAPPVPHAEILTLAELAKAADLEIEMLLDNLSAYNIQASGTDVFGKVAAEQDLSPEELYAIAIGKTQEASGPGRGGGGGGQGRGGFGQKTLRQLCQEMNVSLSLAMDALKEYGIDCSADQNIRRIADENNIRPSEIRGILQTLSNEE